MINGRKLRSALVATALLSGTLVAGVGAAAPALAASGCPSGYKSIQSYDFYDGSGDLAAIGYAYGYPSDVCTMLVAQGGYYGMDKWMSDGIVDVPGHGTGSIWDNGDYRDYAGPIQISDVYGANCKVFYFGMQNSSGSWVFNTDRYLGCD
jgi:hypothetical protein